MPSLQLLTSHHEVRVVLCVPSQVRGYSMYQFPVAPLLQQDRWPTVCDTGGKKRGGVSPQEKSSTRGPTTKNPSLSRADDGGAGKPTAPWRG